MFKKLRELNRPVEYIELPNGEHWRTNEENEFTIFRAIEKFLLHHIGDDA